TVPLLVAVGNAMITLGRLAAESEVVLGDMRTVTLENQKLVNSLERMERTVRQFFLLQNVTTSSDSLSLYDGDQAAFESSIAALRALPSDASIRDQLERLSSISKEVHRAFRIGRTEGAGDAIIARFGVLTEATRGVATGMRDAINQRLERLQDSTRSAQQELVWLSAALIPGILVLVGLFLLLVGRPMRQIDRAIRELGEGDFSRPITVSGPHDIE